jgi:arylsulfatase A
MIDKYANRIAVAALSLTTLITTNPLLSAADETNKQKPNIIFILADDLGIGNLSCYGADLFKTPNIDALAKSGTLFEHCYASPLCGPSRACLMTGRYAYHTGMTGNDSGKLLKPANEIMMPKILKTSGYVTAMCGKWSQLPLQPSDWGFDEYLRFNGSGKYWNTQDGNKTYTLNGQEIPLKDKEYLPDTMQKFAFNFIKTNKSKPFYLYYAISHVHAEILPTPDSAPDSKDLYADNIAYMDKIVGQLIAELDRLHLRDNTLIVFAGDNGTAAENAARSTVHGKPIIGQKATMLECGALVPCIASWPGVVPADKVSKNLLNITDFLPTLADIGGATLPQGLVVDGKDFAPQLKGKEDGWPRSWIFVELGKHWYDRDMNWKLNEASELFDMRNAPFAETKVAADTKDEVAINERKYLQSVLDQLNPAGGIVDDGDGSGRHANRDAKKKKKADKAAGKKATPETNAMSSENANAPGE